MKSTNELKEKVEKNGTKETAKKVIKETTENADMILSDDELDHASGGAYTGDVPEASM